MLLWINQKYTIEHSYVREFKVHRWCTVGQKRTVISISQESTRTKSVFKVMSEY